MLITIGLVLLILVAFSRNATDFGEGLAHVLMYGAAIWFVITYICPLLGVA